MHPWPFFLLNVLKQTAALNQVRRFGISLKLMAPLMTKEMIDARESFFSLASDAVKTRLEREDDPDTDSKKRPDIIGLMLRDIKNSERLTVPEITSNSILIVGGGAETTSTCLSGTFYHLCKTPRVMQKLKDDIRATFKSSDEITIQAVNNMEYLKATIDEGLRIFAVASYITPRTTPPGGHVIAGEVIPGNVCLTTKWLNWEVVITDIIMTQTYVSMAQWYMGRSDKFFNNPQEFKPERWLDSSNDKDRVGPTGQTPDEVLKSFSLGPRNCIGKPLALTEARLVMAKLLWHFDIELDGPHDTWVQDARFYVS
jgi:cytochrome P450